MNDQKNERALLLRDHNFRWFLGGGLVSMLGDQFTLIALPWLVLKISGDAFALGLIVALMGVPRALFILFGGALVDRYSPKRVLMLTKYANALLLGLLAALVLSGQATLPLAGVLAVAIGVATAFSIPSASAMVTHVVAPEQLKAANAILMGVRQATMLAGPLLAGLLFALAGAGSAASGGGVLGLGIAFGFDCFSFVLSACTLAQVTTRVAAPAAAQPILRAVGAGLMMVWTDVALRTAFIYWAVCACVTGGIMQVALPVLATTRLHGATALGIVMAAHGAGTLAGMVLTGVKGRLRVGNLGTTLLAIDVVVGALLLMLGRIDALWQAVLIVIVFGLLGGFMQVAVLTWIQQRVPRAMLGRAMSIFMFILMGLAPLSAAVAGWALRYVALGQLFAGAGLLLAGVAGLAWAFTPMRAMVDAAPAEQA